MVKKRNKLKKVRAAKKKAQAHKRLKLKGRAARPAAKKVARAKLLAKVKKVAAPKPAAAKPHAGKPDDKAAAKGAKTPIKTSAKAALEMLEAKVAEVKGKGKRGRGGRRGGKDAWLIPAEMPKEDAETRRTSGRQETSAG